MQVERTNFSALVETALPDGSRILVDPENQRVFALNATAGAAWDACTAPTTLSGVTEGMQRWFDPAATEELAEEAVLQLRQKKLVRTSGSSSRGNPRGFLAAAMGALALPLVVSLSVAEQQSYAGTANSYIKPTPIPYTPPR